MWNLNQFVTHLNKVPVDPATRRPINAQDSNNWMSRADALAAATDGLGIGFVFTPNDPYWFLDLDNCATPDGTAWQPHALEICSQLAGAAVEVSQSGRGLHLVGCGPVPAERRIKSACGRVELYTHGRFMAEGGRGWSGDPNSQHGPALARLCAQYLALNGSAPAAGAGVVGT
jgi:primase-polymerase (primpol)-like protein